MKISLSLLPLAFVAALPMAGHAQGQPPVSVSGAVLQTEAKSFAFAPTRPRLVVLIHGITNYPDNAPEERINASGHARWYWGFDFIQALLGTPSATEARLIQHSQATGVSFRSFTKDNWTYAPKTGQELPSSTTDLAPVVLPQVPSGSTSDPKRYVSEVFKPASEPATAVMVTFRDGSERLMKQAGAAIDQIYSTYIRTFGHLPENAQPQLYLVGHSFGGIVIRTILTNPTGADLSGGTLSPAQRQRADFIRRRVVWATTMSTPHTSTCMADVSGDVHDLLHNAAMSVPTSADLKGHPAVKKFAGPIVDKTTGVVRTKLEDAIKSAAGDRNSLRTDIQRMAEYNQGLLDPAKGVRPDGSRVPIYTLGGRNPGGLYLDRNRAPFVSGGKVLPHSMIDVLQGDRFTSDTGALFLIQSMLYREGYGKEGKRPWGKAVIPEADLVSSPHAGIGPSQPRSLAAGLTLSTDLVGGILADVLTSDPYTLKPDGENDTDGFCGFDSSHGLGVQGGIKKPFWWTGLYGTSFGSLMPWDVDNHGTLMFNVGNGLWLHNELIRRAGPTPTVGAQGALSFWDPNQLPKMGQHRVKVEVLEVHDINNNLDDLTGNGLDAPEFTVYVRIAGDLKTLNATQSKRTITNLGEHSAADLPQSVIPIVLSVIERDAPPANPHDDCVLSPVPGRDNIYLYFDTRTQRIYGDKSGAAGDSLRVEGYKGAYNRVSLTFRITGN